MTLCSLYWDMGLLKVLRSCSKTFKSFFTHQWASRLFNTWCNTLFRSTRSLLMQFTQDCKPLSGLMNSATIIKFTQILNWFPRNNMEVNLVRALKTSWFLSCRYYYRTRKSKRLMNAVTSSMLLASMDTPSSSPIVSEVYPRSQARSHLYYSWCHTTPCKSFTIPSLFSTFPQSSHHFSSQPGPTERTCARRCSAFVQKKTKWSAAWYCKTPIRTRTTLRHRNRPPYLVKESEGSGLRARWLLQQLAPRINLSSY